MFHSMFTFTSKTSNTSPAYQQILGQANIAYCSPLSAETGHGEWRTSALDMYQTVSMSDFTTTKRVPSQVHARSSRKLVQHFFETRINASQATAERWTHWRPVLDCPTQPANLPQPPTIQLHYTVLFASNPWHLVDSSLLGMKFCLLFACLFVCWRVEMICGCQALARNVIVITVLGIFVLFCVFVFFF